MADTVMLKPILAGAGRVTHRISVPLVMLTAILTASCVALPFPHERRLSPLYFGVVTDAETGSPIGSVGVYVGPKAYSKDDSNVVRTDASGYFEAVSTEKAYWYVFIAAPAVGACGGTLLFAHPDYEMKLEQTGEATVGGVDGPCTGKKRRVDVTLRRAR